MAEKHVSSFQTNIVSSPRRNVQGDKLSSTTTGKSSSLTEKNETQEIKKLNERQGILQQIECAVCLQPCIHPVQLECRHIFCFLCVKGASHRSNRCALCRSEISAEFFANPKLLSFEDLEQTVKFDNQYQWFYQGGNGWWQYDDRTSQEIEAKHKTGEKVFELLIAGFLYIIDLENMVQVRRNDRSRKRKIRRDLISLPGVKGVAGLKYPKSPNASADRPVGDGNEQVSRSSQQNVTRPANPSPTSRVSHPNPTVSNNSQGHIDNTADSSVTPTVPNITPQAPNTPADSPASSVASSQQDLTLSIEIQNLNLGDSLQSDVLHPSPNEDSEQNVTLGAHDTSVELAENVNLNQSTPRQQDQYDTHFYPMTRSRTRHLEQERMNRLDPEQRSQTSSPRPQAIHGEEVSSDDSEEELDQSLVEHHV